MDVIYFLYGFSFIILGVIVVLQLSINKESEFKLISILWLLGLFGITHGLHEYIDMFRIIKGRNLLYDTLGPAFLFISYVSIFSFGYLLVNLRQQQVRKFWIPILTLLAFIGLPVSVDATSYQAWEASARYFFGFEGSLLCAIGFVLYYRNIAAALENTPIKKYFMATAIAFTVYGIAAGLVVGAANFFPASIINEASFFSFFGFPVQVLRGICAFVICVAVWFVMDIFRISSERKLKRLQDETQMANFRLEAANARLLKMDKAKDEFLSIVTHDLKNPINTIMFGADTISVLPEDKRIVQQSAIIASIKRSCLTLSEMIDSILEYTRAEFGKLEPERKPYSINAQIKEILDEQRIIFGRKNISIEAHLPDEEIEIKADRRMINRVISNLLSNALMHTPEGGRVDFSLDKKEGFLQISIKDNGEGIEKQHLTNIFSKFYMVDPKKSRELKNLGLGLYISRSFIEAHGGKIWAESKGLDKGSTFIFTLPI